MRQAWIQITATLGIQMALDLDTVNAAWASPSETDRRALSYIESIKGSRAIPLLQRYARTLSSQAERATRRLLELKKHRIPPATGAVLNERGLSP